MWSLSMAAYCVNWDNDVGLKYDNTDLEDENTVSYLDFPIMLQPLTFTIIASSIQFRLASIFAVSIFMNSSCSK